jgi:ElaB/YqjD/DUF883 family membrane-anchored ribosome-binding protein
MAIETKTYDTPPKATAADSGSVTATAQNIVDKGADAYEKAEQVVGEAYGKAEHVVGEVYDKTTQKVNETYEKAKSYSDENPGKTIFIALGIGVGIGLLLGAGSSHRSITGRIAQPVVNALSEIAHDFLR